MRFPEILAPVGGKKQLVAAVKAGADAVYLAGPAFGARSSANNFSYEELAEAIRYAHLHGVSVYVAVNTLILDDEMGQAMEFIDFLYRNDADAAIVQDIGLLSRIREAHPDFPVHASTQMTFHNVEGVRYAQMLGFTRVVLPREMHISEIRRIAEAVDIELEVFVHGALCMSYSGMCLMSSYIGGRSGNRGSCAQPCRKRYSLYSLDGRGEGGAGMCASQESPEPAGGKAQGGEPTFFLENARVLSPKDLSAAAHLGELLRIPKISLKIEGRLKDYDYVYNVVSAYRRIVDEHPEHSLGADFGNRPEGKPDNGSSRGTADRINAGAAVHRDAGAEDPVVQLQRSYHRGYTKGFLFGEDITEFGAGEHTGNRGTLLAEVLDWKDGRAKIRLLDSLSKGDELQVRAADGSSVGARADRAEFAGEPGVRSGEQSSLRERVRSKQRDGRREETPGDAPGKAREEIPGKPRTKTRDHMAVDPEVLGNPGQVLWIPFRSPLRKGDLMYKTYSVELVKTVDAAMNEDFKAWEVALHVRMHAGHAAEVTARLKGLTVSARGVEVEPAKEKGTDPARIAEQLMKFGGTPFQVSESESTFDIGERIFVPISALNALRREVTEKLSAAIALRYPERLASDVLGSRAASDVLGSRAASDELGLRTASDELGSRAASDVLGSRAETASSSPSSASAAAGGVSVSARSEDVPVATLRLPAIIPSQEWESCQSKIDSVDAVEIAHVSQLAFDLRGKRVSASYTVNVFNSDAAKFLADRGVQRIELSPEIERSWVRLADELHLRSPSATSLTLMRLAYCPVGANFGGGTKCGLCSRYRFAIRDEKGVEFPLRLDPAHCSAEVLSPPPDKKKGKKLLREQGNPVGDRQGNGA